jgi:hypothetical protein
VVDRPGAQGPPGEWQAILQANNSRAPLILRVNERKTTQAGYLQTLAAAHIEAAPVGRHGVILAAPRAVTGLPGFAEGHFSVQDAAAQLAAPLLLEGLAVPAGDNVRLNILDACAAPGGKTAHLLELADCEVTALDIDARRCERVGQNLLRLGLQAESASGTPASPRTGGTAGCTTPSCWTPPAPLPASCGATPTCAGCAGPPTSPSWPPSRRSCSKRCGRCSSPAGACCTAPARFFARKATTRYKRFLRTTPMPY